MAEYTAAVKKELNRLKKQAFKTAQDRELEQLSRQFEQWRKNRISSDTLEYAIDRHKGFKKEMLENLYREDGDPGIPVADALTRGILKKEDVSAEAYKAIGVLIDLANV